MNAPALTLASHLTNPTGQRVAATLGDDMLARVLANEQLDHDLWFELYQATGKKKLPVALAKDAVDRHLSEEQFAHLLKVEKRSSIVGAALEHTLPSWERALRDDFRPHLKDKSVAAKLLAADWLPPVETLATLPAEAWSPSLRSWRLLADSLSDTEVLDELLTFETWGHFHFQRPLAWAIGQRPHLVEQIAEALTHENPSRSLRTALAGSPHLGRLDAASQARLLEIDTAPGRPTEFFNDRAYLWMAAAANPTTHTENIKSLETCLDRQTEVFTSNVATGRINSRNWHIDSIEGPLTPEQMARVIQWALYGETGRPVVLPLLANHPDLCLDDADRILKLATDKLCLVHSLWSMPAIRQAVETILERFPQVEERHPNLPAWDEIATFEARRTAGPAPHQELTPAPSAPPPPWNTRESAPELPVRSLGYANAGVTYIDEQLGDDPEAWRTLFSLIPELMDLTIGDLVTMSRAVLA